MLFIILLCVAISCVSANSQRQVPLSPEFLNFIKPIVERCASETNAPPDVYQNMLDGKMENEATLHFMYCYLLDIGFIVKDGHMNVERLLSFEKTNEDFPREEVRKVYEDCNRLSGDNHLETLRIMNNCYRENSPILYIA